ncbi:MAG: pullulanase-associated domain-containing protein [Solirubrobacteraceae bacterium]
MLNRRSLTSGFRLLVAACAGLTLLAGCGAGDSGQTEARSAHLLAETASVAAAPVAPGSIRMHYHRVQNDTADWGVYSWDGPQNPDTAWPNGRIRFTNTDSFGAYVDIPLAAGKSAIWFLVRRPPSWPAHRNSSLSSVATTD